MVAVVLLAAAAGAGIWWFFRGDAPDAVSLQAATEQVIDTSATTALDATATADTATAATADVATAGTTTIAGTCEAARGASSGGAGSTAVPQRAHSRLTARAARLVPWPEPTC